MPRCIVCDSCSEIDGTSPQKYRWSDKDNGYVCTECRRYSYSNPLMTNDLATRELGEVETLDEESEDLERFEVLVKPRVGTGERGTGDES